MALAVVLECHVLSFCNTRQMNCCCLLIQIITILRKSSCCSMLLNESIFCE